jgi:hypothetical protein
VDLRYRFVSVDLAQLTKVVATMGYHLLSVHSRDEASICVHVEVDHGSDLLSHLSGSVM